MNPEMQHPPAELAGSLRTVLAQGERAMIQLGWTHANIGWRETLDALLEKAERNETHCDACYAAAKAEGAREQLAVLGRCPHGVSLDTDFCPEGCRR